MSVKTEAELAAMSQEEVRLWALDGMAEAVAAEKELADKAATEQAAAEKAAAEAAETPEQIAEREAAEQVEAERVAAEKTAAEQAEQERDAVEDEGEPDEWVIRREVDLGDGSGIQIYAGRGATQLDAIMDLNDQLVKAQENASRELHNIQRKHPKEPEPVKQPEISEDLEYVFKQQFEKKPSEAFKAMFKELTGMDVSDFKTSQAAQKAAEEARSAQERSLQIQRDWVAGHSEYITSQENGDKIRDWVRDHNYNEFTPDNLEKAFEDLSERGLLSLKTDEASASTKTEVTTKVKEAARIETPVTKVETTVTPVRSPKKASSVSTTRSAAPVVKAELTEDDLYDMSREKFAELGRNFPRA